MKRDAEGEVAKKVCPVCRATIQSKFAHCSASCSLAARIPMGKNVLPATWELFGLLVSCFVLFNQILFLAIGWIKLGQGEISLGEDLQAVSLIAGILWLGFAIFVWASSSPKLAGDYLTGMIAFLVLVVPFKEVNAAASFTTRLILVNLLISIRLYRGVFYLWAASKKREK